MAGSIHLFKIRGRLTPENIQFKKNWIWGILEIDWKEVKITLNGNELIYQHQLYHSETNSELENSSKNNHYCYT